jgi:hypothetical protein
MTRRILLVAALALAACKTAPDLFKELSAVEALAAHQSGAQFLDANTEDFRKDNGIVPGAILLASSSKYDVSVLPADRDKPLVFYCSNRL